MKKIFILLICLFLTGCKYDKDLDFSYEEVKILNLGEMTRLEDDVWISDNEEIVAVNGNKVTAVGTGVTYVRSESEIVIFHVKAEIKDIKISGDRNLLVGESGTLKAEIIPALISQNVIWESLDENIATVENGVVKAKSVGLVNIKVTSSYDQTKYAIYQILVTEIETVLKPIIENIYRDEVIKIDNDSGYFYPLFNESKDSVIGVSNYNVSHKLESIGSGIIYKQEEVLNTETGVPSYKYYVITNRHVIKDAAAVKIHVFNKTNEIDAEVIAFDDKVDLAVVTFTSPLYFPVIKIGDSEALQTGEIIMTMGHPRGYDYFNSISLGIVSYPERYMSTDTDGDQINDWDSLYIQHDAAINEGNSGGPLINLKGEVVGINTVKLVAYDIDNMGFAMPINMVMEIVELLEQGITPERAKLGVNVLSVKDILASRAAFAAEGIIIPDEIEYGFYIDVVQPIGIGFKAGLLANDILLTYNNVPMLYSHILRKEISRYLIGSGEVVSIEVYRNGEIITLYVTY